MQALLVLNLIAPFVMVLVGVLLKKHPQFQENHKRTGIMRRALRPKFGFLWEVICFL